MSGREVWLSINRPPNVHRYETTLRNDRRLVLCWRGSPDRQTRSNHGVASTGVVPET